MRRNGRIFAQRVETGFPDLPILEVSLKTGVRVRNLDNGARKQVMREFEKYKRAVQGDIAYNMMRMWQGAVGLAPIDGLVSPAYVVARPYPETEGRYYSYLFRTDAYMDEVNKFSRGIVADRNRLYWEEFKQMPSAFPPLEEQRKIADFLDGHGHLVRRLIHAKQRLIELLNEQKQAIIHDAVTRGLDPDTPMKPTGLDWLPEVPKHWEKVHVGSSVRIVNGFPFDSDLFDQAEGMPLVRIRDIFSISTEVRYTGEEVPEARIDDGDILVGMDGDFNVAIWQGGPALLNQRVCCLKPKSSISREYLAYLLALPLKWLNDQTFSTTVKHLSSYDIRRLRLFMPTLEEQKQIVRSIEEESQAIDAAINRARREIDLIREYRTRLISDVVTGKLDVRGVELPEPDAGEEGVDPGPDALESVVAEDSPEPEEVPDAAFRHQ